VHNEGKDASLVRAGVEAIRNWRRNNPDDAIAAANVVVSGLDLSGADLSEANLTGGRFVTCNFRHASFRNAQLQHAEFNDCDLDDTEFQGADLRATKIRAKSLNGARFGGSASIARLSCFQVASIVQRPIYFDPSAVHIYDRWIGWDRLRFLTTIRIFLPAYTSLTLAIIYINGISWYNSAISELNEKITVVGGLSHSMALQPIDISLIHILVLANFAFLACASTCFLGCPARVVEFSREQWLIEFKEPEIFYDYSTWQRPQLRILCTICLLLGGMLSIFLLGWGIIRQITFIFHNITY